MKGRAGPGRLPALLYLLVWVGLAFAETAAANNPPADLKLNSDQVRAQAPPGTIVGILSTQDADPSDSHAYSLAPGAGDADNGLFTIQDDTLRTAADLEATGRSAFAVRLRTRDGSGAALEKSFVIRLAPVTQAGMFSAYFAANPAVSNLTLAVFDRETEDYFWLYQNELADRGALAMKVPANTPPDTATNGASTVYLSQTELARIWAARAAHATWLDLNGRMPWKLADYQPEHLAGLFDRNVLFRSASPALFYFYSVVDHSPSQAFAYALEQDLVRGNVEETIQAVLDDCRSDFLHGSRSFGDPTCAYRLQAALKGYSTTRWRPARISRAGCHSMSRILLGILRSVNIPGYETTAGTYFLDRHSEVVFPCVGKVLPHGDHVYSASLSATPVQQLMPSFQYYEDNATTPPTGGDPYRIALRHEATQGTLHPSSTILNGVRNPSFYGYPDAASFLSGYAGWDQGLTPEELDQAVNTLLTQYDETHTLTLTTETPRGQVLNNPPTLTYVAGGRVSLKALPQDGYVFDRWTEDAPPNQAFSNPLVFFMDGEKTIQARFTRPPVEISLVRLSRSEISLRFQAIAGVSYRIECRDNLETDSWRLWTSITPQPVEQQIAETAPVDNGPKYFRVVTVDE